MATAGTSAKATVLPVSPATYGDTHAIPSFDAVRSFAASMQKLSRLWTDDARQMLLPRFGRSLYARLARLTRDEMEHFPRWKEPWTQALNTVGNVLRVALPKSTVDPDRCDSLSAKCFVMFLVLTATSLHPIFLI